MRTKPFGVLDPLKYSLRALVSLQDIALYFVLLLLSGELLGGVAIAVGDFIFTGDTVTILLNFYKKVVLDYQKMISFEFNHSMLTNPLLQFWPVTLCVGLIFITVLLWVEVGLVETALHWHDRRTVSIKMLFSRSYKTVYRLVCAVFAVSVVFIFFALILNYLPVVYLGKERGDLFHTIKSLCEMYIYFRVSFIAIYMIDKGSTFIDAMRHAYHPIRWQGGQLFEAYFAVYLCDIGASFIPIVGRALGIWILCFAEVYMYRKLVPYKHID